MALEQQIQKDIMAAMKAKDQVRLNAVRSVKSAILLARTAEGASGELTDGDIVKLIQKLAKQRKEAAEQYALIHRLQPGCLIGNNHHIAPFEGEDIQIFERDLPGENEAGYSEGQEIAHLPLETCQTMNRSWGYDIKDKDYKSPEDLIRYLVRTAGKGANLLLNIGPRPDGTLPEEALERLAAIGAWMDVYGETIYGTEAGCTGPQDWGVSTQKGDILYLHVLDPADVISVDLERRIKSAESFPEGSALRFEQKKHDSAHIYLPEASEGKVDQVVKLVLK